ncbi:Hint domain-containing protein [Paracoccus sp. (in: a-proteobacteria)]|uniref:Hint domain-containing protein n=1 Tax=Paracoccus sp. TaxID=267 RepID=UPI003A859DDE
MAGSGLNEDATNLFGMATSTTAGNTGAYGNVQHTQFTINGVLTDIVISTGNRGVEFFTMDANTGALTLKTSAYIYTTPDQGYHKGEIFQSNGNLYFFKSWNANSADATTVAGYETGDVTYKLDTATGQWTPIAQQYDQNFTSLTNIGNPETTGALTFSEFTGGDGEKYMWTAGGYGFDVSGHFYSKMHWNTTTEKWDLVTSANNSSELTVGVNGLTLAQWQAKTGLYYQTIDNEQSIKVIKTSDGLKMLMAGASSSNNHDDQLTVFDLDAQGNIQYDANGQTLRTTFNLTTGTTTYGDGTAGPSFPVVAGDPNNASYLLQNVRLDPNTHNIFMSGGATATTNGNGGIMVLSPNGDSVVFKDGPGVGLVTGTGSLGQISPDANIAWADGKIYITSQLAWTDAYPHTIILDASNYSIISQGTDTSSFAAVDQRADGYVSLTTVAGKMFMIERVDASASDATGYAPLRVAVSSFGSSPLCFAAGTMILTARGEVPVEKLKKGDMIVTRDRGIKPIAWIGKQHVSARQLRLRPHLMPIRIARGALGPNTPSRDLVVSPQHRILVRSAIAQRIFGEWEVLIAAKRLIGIPGIEQMAECDGVDYYHFLFDCHEIVFADGAEAESLFTGPEAIKAVPASALQEIFELFPELMNGELPLYPARTLAEGKPARNLVSRHMQNRRALCSSDDSRVFSTISDFVAMVQYSRKDAPGRHDRIH